MPESQPAAPQRRRVTAIAVAATVAWGLAVAGLLATVPAAQSLTGSSTASVSYAGSAPALAAEVAVDRASTALDRSWRARTVAVFGDSMSARFNNRAGDAEQGFWSMLAHDIGGRPKVWAEPGAGFVNPGEVGCTGHTFAQQLARPGVAETVAGAGAVVIEGGRTDTQTCRRGGGYDLVPDRQVRRAVEAFMAEVQRLRGDDGTCTLVVVPWGPAGLVSNRDRITAIVQQAAARHGFTFIDTVGLLNESNTIEDGVHPTRSGNKTLTRAILDQSAAEGCIA